MGAHGSEERERGREGERERDTAHAKICSWAFGFVLSAAGLDERAWIPTHPHQHKSCHA